MKKGIILTCILSIVLSLGGLPTFANENDETTEVETIEMERELEKRRFENEDNDVVVEGGNTERATDMVIVTYVTNGGYYENSETLIPKGSQIDFKSQPVKEGEAFNAWYTDPEFNNEWDIEDLVYEDLTLYARYSEAIDEKEFSEDMLSMLRDVYQIEGPIGKQDLEKIKKFKNVTQVTSYDEQLQQDVTKQIEVYDYKGIQHLSNIDTLFITVDPESKVTDESMNFLKELDKVNKIYFYSPYNEDLHSDWYWVQIKVSQDLSDKERVKAYESEVLKYLNAIEFVEDPTYGSMMLYFDYSLNLLDMSYLENWKRSDIQLSFQMDNPSSPRAIHVSPEITRSETGTEYYSIEFNQEVQYSYLDENNQFKKDDAMKYLTTVQFVDYFPYFSSNLSSEEIEESNKPLVIEYKTPNGDYVKTDSQNLDHMAKISWMRISMTELQFQLLKREQEFLGQSQFFGGPGRVAQVLVDSSIPYEEKIEGGGTLPSSNIDLFYIRYEVAFDLDSSYRVDFETNGGSLINSKLIGQGKPTQEPTLSVKEGYEFEGWYADAAFKTRWDFSMPITEDTTLYAKWDRIPVNYTITFETNGGSPIASKQVLENTLLSKPQDPSRDGYTFVGWYADDKFNSEWDFGTQITVNTTLYAKWERIPVNYTVTFNSNNGSKVEAQKVLENTRVSKPKDPSRDGYTFVGWYADDKFNSEWNFEIQITEDTTIYAKWDRIPVNYMVVFESNNGSRAEAYTVLENTPVSKPKDPSRDGYTFVGWYADDKFSSEWDFATQIKEDTTLYAKWNRIPVNYTVTFESNGGSPIASKQVLENTSVSKPQNPVRDGYTFAGWYVDDKFSSEWDFATQITENTTLYAKWERIPVNYTVTFNSNNGSKVEAQTVLENTPVSKPQNPVRDGYTFVGWYTDDKFSSEWNFETQITEDTTLYAKWDRIPVNYTVTFNSNNGSKVEAQTVLENTPVSKPQDPSRDGYTFAGWYEDDKFSSEWDFVTKITEDTTLYAKWDRIPVNYTVTFESNGGSSIASKQVLENTPVSKPQDPSRDGYTFVGWYTDDKFSSEWNFETQITEDTTLYAKWDRIPVNYTVTFNSNNGSKVEAQTVLENTPVSKPQDPSRDGYTFAGWYEDDKFSSEWDFATQIIEDTTLYAKWDRILVDYTVTFESNGGSTVDVKQVLENTAVEKPQDPSRDGYTFVGWYVDDKFSSEWNFETQVTEDTTLYAKWKRVPVSYTITFNHNDGKREETKTILENTLLEKPKDPTKEGYSFAGWYVDAALKTEWDFATIVTGNITLNAKWERIPLSFIVIFDSKNGSGVETQTILENTVLKKPQDPLRDGYRFVGWFADDKFNDKWNFATQITGNTTLYAKWEKDNMSPLDPNVSNEPSKPIESTTEKILPKTGIRNSYVNYGLYLIGIGISLIVIKKKTSRKK